MSEAAIDPPQSSADIRPVVRTANPGNLGLWLFGAGLLVGGALLFNALNNRRQDMVAATALPASQTGGMIGAPPPLAVPQTWLEPPVEQGYSPVLRGRLPSDPTFSPAPQVVTRFVERPAPAAPFIPEPAPQFVQRPPVPAIIERPAQPETAATSERDGKDRVTAGHLLNPSLTVPQGTVIAAVLETALDSTRAGGVRAIVSRDVKSFDGSRILIPRGSRIYGEYTSDLAAGQRRALVQWHRLTRPDAVVIDLDSPAADPLGRTGVHGKVNSNFLARYGGAILQSVLDIGVGVATRAVTDDQAVIVALPGSTQQVTAQQAQGDVQRTLKVEQGTSVSVFVARDLDFSTVDR
ncbi:conjugal transfer protein TrbI [Croceibacterium sp. LX-88]|uniref:Conjugal transfer protein TrbI n=1 Tax=Croceibacterium selenioxidans TaxID=2838833 RepID=A0ABS5W5B4_9SPHN|nr:TrbI/VirB10 family protein [Croceibacterium selenioxidans]MBT2134488.1 conjugal transfer protein TrbI [Croceibacterium selenioxidans]